MNIIFFIMIICLTTINEARDEDTKHVWEGNLALPISQQPTPLFAVGQNIVAKGDFQIFNEAFYLRGNQKIFTDVIPGILFGVSDNLSLFFNLPTAAHFKINQNSSSGIEDIFLQTEYAFYNYDTENSAIQATLVGTFYFPTGSSKKNPSTGIDAATIFFGTTLSYTGTDWYAFVSPGGAFPLSNNDDQASNRFLYQTGLGKNIAYSSKKWLLTGLIELYGVSSKIIAGNAISGHNLFLGPTFWFATQRLILQAGILVSVVNNKTTSCPDNKNKYWAAANIGWKFN